MNGWATRLNEKQTGAPRLAPFETWAFHLFSVIAIPCHPERSRGTLCLFGWWPIQLFFCLSGDVLIGWPTLYNQ